MATLGTPNAAEAYLEATAKIMDMFDEPLAPVPRWASVVLDLDSRRLARAYLASAKMNLDLITPIGTLPAGARAKMTPDQIMRAMVLMERIAGVKRGLTYRVQELTKVMEKYDVKEE